MRPEPLAGSVPDSGDAGLLFTSPSALSRRLRGIQSPGSIVSGEGYAFLLSESDVAARGCTGWPYTRARSTPERCDGGGSFGGR